ncbi:GntR family transcriptional regulator, partial [Corynebacterium kefirresidentii]
MQIAAALRTQVAAGVLLPGERVASTRTLATQLGVSRGSVVT